MDVRRNDRAKLLNPGADWYLAVALCCIYSYAIDSLSMKLPKISIIGFVALLLVGIPLALYSVRQPTNVQEHAAGPIKPTISYLIQDSLPTGDNGIQQKSGWTFSSNKYNWWIAARNDSTTPIEFTGTLDCKTTCEDTQYGWPNTENQRVTATIKPKQVMYVFVNGRTCLDVQLDFTSPGPQAGRGLVSEACTAVTPTKSPTPSVVKTPTPIKTPTPSIKVSPTPTKKLTPTPTVKITPTPTKKLTPTPTVKPSKTPTPSLSVTPSISPTEGPTPTVPACILPKPVTNVHVVCPYCGAE